MADERSAILDFYRRYTEAFQSAYEAWRASGAERPDAGPALPFYETPCTFVSGMGVEVHATPRDLERYFEQVMRDMKERRYVRTGLGPHHLHVLGSRTALLGLEVERFDEDGKRYDHYAVSYTLRRGDAGWRVVVVTTHPSGTVIPAASD